MPSEWCNSSLISLAHDQWNCTSNSYSSRRKYSYSTRIFESIIILAIWTGAKPQNVLEKLTLVGTVVMFSIFPADFIICTILARAGNWKHTLCNKLNCTTLTHVRSQNILQSIFNPLNSCIQSLFPAWITPNICTYTWLALLHCQLIHLPLKGQWQGPHQWRSTFHIEKLVKNRGQGSL